MNFDFTAERALFDQEDTERADRRLRSALARLATNEAGVVTGDDPEAATTVVPLTMAAAR